LEGRFKDLLSTCSTNKERLAVLAREAVVLGEEAEGLMFDATLLNEEALLIRTLMCYMEREEINDQDIQSV
jgi:hypothetical protein